MVTRVSFQMLFFAHLAPYLNYEIFSDFISENVRFCCKKRFQEMYAFYSNVFRRKILQFCPIALIVEFRGNLGFSGSFLYSLPVPILRLHGISPIAMAIPSNPPVALYAQYPEQKIRSRLFGIPSIAIGVPPVENLWPPVKIVNFSK